MDMFNTKRRDVYDFDSYMDLKNPGFGGAKSALPAVKIGKEEKLNGYRRVVKRDPLFGDHYDSTYKAMTHDVVYKQEGEDAFDYNHGITGIPVVDLEDALERSEKLKKSKAKMTTEGKAFSKFTRFVNEQEMPDGEYSNAALATGANPYDEEEYEEEEEDFGNFGEEPTPEQIKELDKLFMDEEYGANPFGMKEYDVEPMSWDKIEALDTEEEYEEEDEEQMPNEYSDREPSDNEIAEIERLLLGSEEEEEEEY
jgi:hypothetical protein